MNFAVPLSRKVVLIIAGIVACAVLTAGITAFVLRHELRWLKTCEAGLQQRDQCRFSAAEELLIAAASISTRFAPTDERRFTSELLLAELYVAVGNFGKADEYLAKAKATAELQNNVQNKLTVMMLVADELFRKAKFEECRNVCLKAYELAEKSEQIKFQIDALFTLTKLDILFLKREDSAEKIREIDMLHTKLKQPTATGVALSVYTAMVAELRARYKTAAMLYGDADRIATYEGRPLAKMKVFIANNSAHFYFLDRNIVRAKNFAMRTLDNCDKDFESYFAGDILQALRNLSAISLAENDLRRARQFGDRELEEVGKRLSHEHPYYGQALAHRAVLQAREGKIEESERDFKAAQEIFEKALGVQNRYSADSLHERAKLQLEKNDLDRSANLCKQAIAMYKAILPNDHPSALATMMTLADVYRKQGKSQMAQAMDTEAHVAFSAAEGK